MVKRDAYKFAERWESWKQEYFKSMKGIRREDHKLLVEFLQDMELGLNTPTGMNGKRGPGTLLNLSSHNLFFLRNFKKPLVKLTKKDLHALEDKVSRGEIKKRNGEPFTQFGNYIKDFKVLWHWLQRTKKVSEDITSDLSAKTKKPSWVYLSEEQIKKFFNNLNFDMRVLCWFMYDSGARVTEANSIKIENFSNDFTEVDIPDEVAKTFGRTIKLKICSQLVKEYIKAHDLKPSDYLFMNRGLFAINKYLKYHCGKRFGKDKVSSPKSKGLYGQFTLYDIRHNSSCYWLNRYPSQKGLMYRFGWKDPDKIQYYSEFLGVADEITDNDMVIGEDRNKIYKLESELQEERKERQRLQANVDERLKRIDKFLEIIGKDDSEMLPKEDMGEISKIMNSLPDKLKDEGFSIVIQKFPSKKEIKKGLPPVRYGYDN